jgi:hypothetical protein
MCQFSNSWLKTTANTNDPKFYKNVRKGTTLMYKDQENYGFELKAEESGASGFNTPEAVADLLKFPKDLNGNIRKYPANGGVTAGAYERP